MRNRFNLLSNVGAGASGEPVEMAADNAHITVTASVWGGESVKLQELGEGGVYSDIPGAVFTQDAANVYQGYRGQTIRAVTTGAGGTMAGVAAVLGQRFD